MKLAIARWADASPEARDGAPLELGTNAVRFGDEVFVYAANNDWAAVSRGATAGGLDLRPLEQSANKADLHLVIQKGRLFQQENPKVPILLNKGRYLVVELPAAKAGELADRPPCYSVRPLPGVAVAFEARRPPAARAAPAAWVQDVVGRLGRASLEADLTHLTSYKTRHSLSPLYTKAAEWARQQLQALGYDARLEAISVGTKTSQNVVADRPGKGPAPRGLVLVTAHLDSVNHDGGPAAKAPGADDNASGSAGVLALARVLATFDAANDLRLVLFGGEEQGLHGSLQFVGALTPADRARVRVALNMDMIGCKNTPATTVLLEGAAVSQQVLDGLAGAAATYTGLAVQTSLNPFNSDHVPFIDAGMAGVLTIEGADSANDAVHSANDTPDRIDYDLALDILRMNAAFLATTLGRHETTAVPAPVDRARPAAHEDEIVITIRRGTSLADVLRRLGARLSGRYTYNGGASFRESRGFIDPTSGQARAALGNPIYKLKDPVYIDDPAETSRSSPLLPDPIRMTLHVDIDGTDPLNVVSGTVAGATSGPGSPPPHFIGRVTSGAMAGDERRLVVEDFRFRWPDSIDLISRLEVHLAGSLLAPPTASVTFVSLSGERRYGPFSMQQESTYFREVEVDVDREANAVAVELYDTDTHPDRPADLPGETLTLESAYAKAGIRVTRSAGSGSVVPSPGDGDGGRWSYRELHDSMQLHWDAFANRPQWKMWVFLAGLGESDELGGVMFDGDIDEPGGVDRQGTAIFTRCPFFHTTAGGYIVANPPVAEAVKRELFFNLIHETGHAFNLAHSFQKQLVGAPGEGAWTPPVWMPLTSNDQALSWMNYPDRATPGAAGLNASWFYNRFRFRFDDTELLFLRHAPESFVQMGNAAWFDNHGRVSRGSLDRRLKLLLRSNKEAFRLGEAVFVELRLSNVSREPVKVHENLNPGDGFVELAVTNPRGQRRPFLLIAHTRALVKTKILAPGERLYQGVNLTMGHFGFPFKEPGAYRVEASYTNVDGTTAAAVLQLYVSPPSDFAEQRAVNEMFDARIGRAIYVGGTRVMEDVNEKIDWLCEKLGERSPISHYLQVVRSTPLARPTKLVHPDGTVKVEPPDPDEAVKGLEPVIKDLDEAADTMGNIRARKVVDTYAHAALLAGGAKGKGKARQAQQKLLGLFQKRKVIAPVVQAVEARVNELT
jgi:Zn-dependent M28 family amino/carboxypeptidase